MSNQKTAFTLYFDNMDLACQLPDEQLATLTRAIVHCAAREAEGADGITEVKELWPQMAPETWMAFQFIAQNIRRDTRAYRAKQARYREGARKRLSRGEEQNSDIADILKYI